MARRDPTGFIIVAGYGAVISTVGGFIRMVVDRELDRSFGARRMSEPIDRLEGDTIIRGYGRTGPTLAEELQAADKSFVANDTEPIAPGRDRTGRGTGDGVLRRRDARVRDAHRSGHEPVADGGLAL